jgi:hypothetical protein
MDLTYMGAGSDNRWEPTADRRQLAAESVG